MKVFLVECEGKTKFVKKKSGHSDTRQIWFCHMRDCHECLKNFFKASLNSNSKGIKVLENMDYLRGVNQNKKTNFYNLTFLCGYKCSYIVRNTTSTPPVKQEEEEKKSSGRMVNVGAEGETVVCEHKYVVSREEAYLRRKAVSYNKTLVKTNRAAKEKR